MTYTRKKFGTRTLHSVKLPSGLTISFYDKERLRYALRNEVGLSAASIRELLK
jgi:hypothetical protein